MANTSTPDLVIQDLRGGMNNQDPAHSLPLDQCVLAENVEFFLSTIGERRRGTIPIDMTDSDLTDLGLIAHLMTYLPGETEVADTELWATAATFDVETRTARRVNGTWEPITPIDAIANSAHEVLNMASVSLHGKLFTAYKSDVDRMHVFDGTSWRRAGIAAPIDAPTVMDSGSEGSFTGDRTYRVRLIQRDGDTILQESEPSPEIVFTPSGTNDGAIITQPADFGPDLATATDWIVEASDGDGNFYQIATVDIGTTVYTDMTQPATDYAEFELSEPTGFYDLIPSARYITADQDRVIFAGSWTDDRLNSRVMWTAVYNATGFGNDERIPANIDSYLDLDWLDGGSLTGISNPQNGSFYAFKRNRIYKLQRTGVAASAYTAFLISNSRGAVPGSIITGVDEAGRGAIYFLDPATGPSRISTGGIQQLNDLQSTWRRVATGSDEMVAHGVFYPDKKQIHWWVAVDGQDTPGLRMVLQTNEMRTGDDNSTTRGWSLATGTSQDALCSVIVPTMVLEGTSLTLSFRPYIGMTNPHFVQLCDIGDTDDGDAYVARIVTRPYILAGLLNKWGTMAAALLAEPNENEDVLMTLRQIRDFGLESSADIDFDFVPVTTESQVIKFFDQFEMSDARSIQFEFVDKT